MTDGSRPDLLRASPGPRRRRSGQWIGVAVVAVGIAGAAVVVPPLITPDRDRAAPEPSKSPSARTTRPIVSQAAPSLSASFAPISIQAEDPKNQITGGASAVACRTCRGGQRVRYMCAECSLVVHATLPVAGTRTITVYYEADGDRSLKVRINAAAPRTFLVNGPQWTVPQSLRFTAELPAGPVQLTLYNDQSPAPDLDEIAIG
ncbi:hypothetical protein [Dactylosporangium sp. CA-233914]|uniref:hypothetical protein n=1 Tax=Dactylosporangium sp. CA-233914 TaxID=3239934 RepID=UPI003D908567